MEQKHEGEKRRFSRQLRLGSWIPVVGCGCVCAEYRNKEGRTTCEKMAPFREENNVQDIEEGGDENLSIQEWSYSGIRTEYVCDKEKNATNDIENPNDQNATNHPEIILVTA